MNPNKAELMGAIGMGLVTVAMLLWAIFGSPPYAFFGILKWVVAGVSVYSAWFCWRLNRALAPIGLIMLCVAAIHLLGKMRRHDWALFNWAAIGGLGLVVIFCVLALKKQSRAIPSQ